MNLHGSMIFIFCPYFQYKEGKSFIPHSGFYIGFFTENLLIVQCNLCAPRRFVKKVGIGINAMCVSMGPQKLRI